MISNPENPESGVTDPEQIQQSVRQLDRSTSWFWWNSLVLLVLLSATWVALSPPESLVRYALSQQLDLNSIGRGLIAVMLILNSYSLFHQRHLERFRHRLAEQM